MLTFKQNELDLADATKEDAARPIDMSEFPLSALLDPHPLFERDRAKWMAEGHRRLTEPLTTLSYALVGLFSSLGGISGGTATSSAHSSLSASWWDCWRWALHLARSRHATTACSGLMWLQAIVPAVVCAWLLFAPSFRLFDTRRSKPDPMTAALNSLALYRQAVRARGHRDVAGAVRPGVDVRFHRAVAPFRQSPGGQLRLGQPDRRATPPYVAMQILPFAILLGGILCFWRLTRSSELIVARAAGISAWEFLTAPTLCAFLFGVVATALVSPVSSVMLARAESDGQCLSAQRRWPARTEWRSALAAAVRSPDVAARCRHHPCPAGGITRQAVDRPTGQRVPPGRLR